MSRGGGAAELVDRLAAVITVTGGRRAGDPETRIQLDHLMPSPDALGSADGPKGRRLLVADLAAERRVAALLSWHFEPGRRRPHLVTSAAVRSAVPEDVRVDYLVALWVLLCASLAIDQLSRRNDRHALHEIIA